MARVFYILDSTTFRPFIISKPFFHLSETDQTVCTAHQYCYGDHRSCKPMVLYFGDELVFSHGDVLYRRTKVLLDNLKLLHITPIHPDHTTTKKDGCVYQVLGSDFWNKSTKGDILWWRSLATELLRLKRLAKKYKRNAFVMGGLFLPIISSFRDVRYELLEETESISI
jgi:hypothetical protein